MPQKSGFNYKVEDATLNWAKLNPTAPVSPFGVAQWELQIETADKKVADDWVENHLKVKEKDGLYTVGLKRKASKYDGTPQAPLNVVDGLRNPIDMSTIKIANGSIGNVILWIYPWETAGKSGWASTMTALQVTKLIEYTGGMGFDEVTDEIDIL